ncbi:acyl carrier protein [Desulfuribacillus stibiiarsenatis]|uniref:Acyl carrier protein n=1 Tax=Desulfuribacillus stibiiarsenatis TaxID=1390249 RepID=A0A1E5L9Q5_9FIRM|nr:acyl carrier protein [Desulfuribacillus stibiiarsenatis]OEH86749.1 acyl carrier protein [Desulfuribacillus stibiiarsenatis]
MNEQKLRQIFSQSLGIDESQIIDTLEYSTIPEWDSIAHMSLIAAIDEAFDIMLDTEDVIDMSSYGKAKEILKKYDVEF